MRRILLVSGIAVVSLLMLAILLVKTWGTTYAWSLVVEKARAAGIEVSHEELSWNWNGGLGLTLRLRGVTARTLVPGTLSFDLKIPAIDLTAALLRTENLVVVDNLAISGVAGKFSLEPEARKEDVPRQETAARIPDLSALEIEIPRPPVGVELRSVKIEARELEVSAGRVGGGTISLFDLQGNLTWREGAFELTSTTRIEGRDARSENSTLRARVGKLRADVKLDGGFVAATDKKMRVTIVPAVRIDLENTAVKSVQARGQELEPRVEKLAIEARLTESGPSLKIAGEGARGIPGVPGAVGISVEIIPRILPGEEARIDIDADAPGLLRAKGWVQAPRRLSQAASSMKGNVSFEARGNLFALFVPEWPPSLTAPMTGNLKIERVGAEKAAFSARVSSSWLRLALEARAGLQGTTVRDADADGSLQVNLPTNGVRWNDLRLGGGLRIPVKLLFRDGERFYIESEMEFRGLSFRQPGLAIEGVSGAFFVSQSWAARRGSWRMSPVHAWNPFSRVDLASSETLDPDQKILTIDRIAYGDRFVGPLRMSASFRQNQLFVPSWNLASPQGRFQGVLLTDVRPDQPRMGLSFNAIEVDLSRILPEAMTGGRKIATDPTSFVLNVDWDVQRAQAFGSFDWLRMTPGQVHAALDVFDPLGEKPAFNMTRSLLSTAYPTRVRVTMKGAVADTRVATNIADLPPIANVAISPYLVKYRENLFEIPLVKSARQLEAP